jgi:hypothetical protein
MASPGSRPYSAAWVPRARWVGAAPLVADFFLELTLSLPPFLALLALSITLSCLSVSLYFSFASAGRPQQVFLSFLPLAVAGFCFCHSWLFLPLLP